MELRMFANLANSKKLVRATVGGVLATLLVLAPGAAAVGADVVGNAQGQLNGAANAQGALGLVDELKGTVDGAAQSAAALDANADVTAKADASGAANAGLGFIATAKGFLYGLLDGIKGMFDDTKADAEAQVAAAQETGMSTKADAEAKVHAAKGEVEAKAQETIGAVHGLKGEATARADAAIATASSVEPPAVPEPRAPKVDVSLTSSLQAAFAGILTLF